MPNGNGRAQSPGRLRCQNAHADLLDDVPDAVDVVSLAHVRFFDNQWRMLQTGEITAEEFERTADEVTAHCDDPHAEHSAVVTTGAQEKRAAHVPAFFIRRIVMRGDAHKPRAAPQDCPQFLDYGRSHPGQVHTEHPIHPGAVAPTEPVDRAHPVPATEGVPPPASVSAVETAEARAPASPTAGPAGIEPSAVGDARAPGPGVGVPAPKIANAAAPPIPPTKSAALTEGLAPCLASRPANLRLAREETAKLLKRGEELMSEGRVSAARLVFQRAAEACDARASFALGASYDPIILQKLGVTLLDPNVPTARTRLVRSVSRARIVVESASVMDALFLCMGAAPPMDCTTPSRLPCLGGHREHKKRKTRHYN
jgi:hypothetical protein